MAMNVSPEAYGSYIPEEYPRCTLQGPLHPIKIAPISRGPPSNLGLSMNVGLILFCRQKYLLHESTEKKLDRTLESLQETSRNWPWVILETGA